LEAGRNCLVVADFGLTGYSKAEGSEFNHVDDRQASAIQAAWKKLRPEQQDQRLTIVTLTNPMEIRKWTRAKYDDENFFNQTHGKTMEKLIATMSKLNDAKQIVGDYVWQHDGTANALAAEKKQGDDSRLYMNDDDERISDCIDSEIRSNATVVPAAKLELVASDSVDGHEIASNATTRLATGNMSSHVAVDVKKPADERRSYKEHMNVENRMEEEPLPQSDPDIIVLARANFLLENMNALPPYHVFYSNSECIAVWCKTGRWSTLQTAVFLSTNSVGAAKSSILATMGVAAAHALLAPVVAIGGIIWVSAPMVILKKSREQWERTTMHMTDLFWSSAPPIVFVAAIENWNGVYRRKHKQNPEQVKLPVDIGFSTLVHINK
jgi:hypothetical protein